MRTLAAALASVLLLAAPIAASSSSWTPADWAGEATLELVTTAPGEAPYAFPVWLVVLDDRLYVRLGSRAARRVQQSATPPFVGVTVAGAHFDRVRCEPAPGDEARVAEAMARKYWSDIFIRFVDHPLTCRLVPE